MLRSGMEKRQGDGLDSASQSAVKLGRFLPCERFHLLIHVKTLMVLPPYKGGIFRSAFGRAFRGAVCAAPRTDCDACILAGQDDQASGSSKGTVRIHQERGL
jgi:hypothetical protein